MPSRSPISLKKVRLPLQMEVETLIETQSDGSINSYPQVTIRDSSEPQQLVAVVSPTPEERSDGSGFFLIDRVRHIVDAIERDREEANASITALSRAGFVEMYSGPKKKSPVQSFLSSSGSFFRELVKHIGSFLNGAFPVFLVLSVLSIFVGGLVLLVVSTENESEMIESLRDFQKSSLLYREQFGRYGTVDEVLESVGAPISKEVTLKISTPIEQWSRGITIQATHTEEPDLVCVTRIGFPEDREDEHEAHIVECN